MQVEDVVEIFFILEALSPALFFLRIILVIQTVGGEFGFPGL